MNTMQLHCPLWMLSSSQKEWLTFWNKNNDPDCFVQLTGVITRVTFEPLYHCTTGLRWLHSCEKIRMKLLEFYIEMSLTWTLKTLISQTLVMFSTQRADVGRSLTTENMNFFWWPQLSLLHCNTDCFLTDLIWIEDWICNRLIPYSVD